MDPSLFSAATSFITGAMQASTQRSISKIAAQTEEKINKLNRETAAAANARNAVTTRMARWAQEVSNARVHEQVGAYQEQLSVNFNRQRDQRTRENFALNIAFAEEEGRQQAAAAASGVTGSVVDVINITSRLRSGIERTARRDAEAQSVYDQQVLEADTRRQLLDNGLDWSVIFDNVQQAQQSYTPRQDPSVIGSGVASVLGMGSKNLSTLAGAISDLFKPAAPAPASGQGLSIGGGTGFKAPSTGFFATD